MPVKVFAGFENWYAFAYEPAGRPDVVTPVNAEPSPVNVPLNVLAALVKL
jgi:hypothetical protein